MIDGSINIRKIAIQSILWIAYAVLLYSLYSARYTGSNVVLATVFILGLHIVLFYLNYSLLMPQLYFKRKSWSYAILVLLSLIVVVLMAKLLMDHINQLQSSMQQMARDMDHRPRRMLRNGFSFFRYVPILFPAVIVLLISSVLKYAEQISLKEKEMLTLKSASMDAELKLLRSQINPHFLFNALNNIYSMSVEKLDATPDVILKFSNMLRYMIYESNVDYVSLSKEIENIKNYICTGKKRRTI